MKNHIYSPGRSRLLLVYAALAWAVLVSPLHAQPFAINWYKVSGGGGTSTNAPFTLSGTIGQHDAGGPMTGTGFSLTGGFWALYAVQTPGAPRLRIFLTTTNTAVVAWPAPSTGFVLQQNSVIGTVNWSNVLTSPIVVGGENQMIVSPPVGNKFYRLKQ